MKKVFLEYDECYAVYGREHKEGDLDPIPPRSVVVEVSDEKWAEWQKIEEAYGKMSDEQQAMFEAAGGER